MSEWLKIQQGSSWLAIHKHRQWKLRHRPNIIKESARVMCRQMEIKFFFVHLKWSQRWWTAVLWPWLIQWCDLRWQTGNSFHCCACLRPNNLFCQIQRRREQKIIPSTINQHIQKQLWPRTSTLGRFLSVPSQADGGLSVIGRKNWKKPTEWILLSWSISTGGGKRVWWMGRGRAWPALIIL